MSLIDSLNWRYATTKFDSSKSISERDLEKLKDKKSVTGTRCIVTTTISVKMLEGFIKKYNKIR